MMRTNIAVSMALLVVGCQRSAPDSADADRTPDPGVAAAMSADDRAALFDDLVSKTSEREAFSDVKNERLALDVMDAMLHYRDEVIGADTDEDLFYALTKLSNARRDRHLEVTLVPEGLRLEHENGVAAVGLPETPAPLVAPIRFAPDYGKDDPAAFFVTDFANDVEQVADGVTMEVGDRLLSVNGRSAARWVDDATPFMRHSSVAGLRWKLGELLPELSFLLPPQFFRDRLELELEKSDGTRYAVGLPYVAAADVEWKGFGDPRYPGFELVFETPTFDLHRASTGRTLLLSWVGFREHMVEDVDRLVAWAEAEDALDSDIIFDATRSGGGSRGPYAIQQLSPKPFKTTFGNLRISDVTQPFIDDKREEFRSQAILDNGVSETDDDGSWLIEWLETDLTQAIERGDEYSTNVPFKNAHASKDSDGILQPAPVHFRGDLVVLLGPFGGSHLDQFASIVSQNGLGTIIGMPAGGYSNTWEWEETITALGSGRPVVSFMWSIGHSIRPDGEVLEGNPVDVDEWIPLEPETSAEYYDILIARALEILEGH